MIKPKKDKWKFFLSQPRILTEDAADDDDGADADAETSYCWV